MGGRDMPRFWVVGSKVSGQDLVATFINHGFWFGDKDTAQDKIAQIAVGDRLAIKKMLGQGATDVAIKAIGVVEDIGDYNALNFRIVYVNWIGIEGKTAPFSGLGGTIHGPFDQSDNRVAAIFNLY